LSLGHHNQNLNKNIQSSKLGQLSIFISTTMIDFICNIITINIYFNDNLFSLNPLMHWESFPLPNKNVVEKFAIKMQSLQIVNYS